MGRNSVGTDLIELTEKMRRQLNFLNGFLMNFITKRLQLELGLDFRLSYARNNYDFEVCNKEFKDHINASG